jgi:hypothetical protein
MPKNFYFFSPKKQFKTKSFFENKLTTSLCCRSKLETQNNNKNNFVFENFEKSIKLYDAALFANGITVGHVNKKPLADKTFRNSSLKNV